ncbi:hypothetical protein SAST42_03265 [Staphylococcus aureus]|nr:hypothetical protein SAST42_03265 [Staphylococcus aureus]AMV84165.1 hypothetical protein SAST43_03061 [Staphylococcus aureus]
MIVRLANLVTFDNRTIYDSLPDNESFPILIK